MNLKLELSEGEFDALHRAADSKAATVRVTRSGLSALLRDHSKLLAERDRGWPKEGLKGWPT